MNKKLQVFVSSTYTDLIEERQAAVEAISKTGHIPVGTELYGYGKSPMQTVCRLIDESDVYILILGGRYGSIEEESGLSYTELEYRYALSKKMPVFVMVLDDSYLFAKLSSCGKNVIFEKGNTYQYNSFKNKVESNNVKFVSNIDQIYSVIHEILTLCITDPVIINTSNHLQTSAFVVMPFSEKWSEETYEIIKDVCNNLNIKLSRADEILGSQSIYNDIITNIIESDIIIADITVKNANVFYELGYAHALKKL